MYLCSKKEKEGLFFKKKEETRPRRKCNQLGVSRDEKNSKIKKKSTKP